MPDLPSLDVQLRVISCKHASTSYLAQLSVLLLNQGSVFLKKQMHVCSWTLSLPL